MADDHGEQNPVGEVYRILRQLDAARTGDGRGDERLTIECAVHLDLRAERVVVP
jgi:hypothetical protein